MKNDNCIITALKKEEKRKEFIMFSDLLNKYNIGLKNGFDYYMLSISILINEYSKINSIKAAVQETGQYKKKWNEIYCFLNKLNDFIDNNYLKLKRFKMFSNIIHIDELVDYHKKEWDIRKKQLLEIKTV